jgi:serine O-acetyltransferase
VVKAVPAGATVVGVPGRIVNPERSEIERRRHATAQKLGFDAYGATSDAPDPVANAINSILDHVHAMDDRLESMCAAIKALNAEFQDVKVPELGNCGMGEGESDAAKKEETGGINT